MQKQLPKLLQGLTILALLFTVTTSWGQTNPTAQNLPYSFTALSTGTLPAGMAAHRFGTSAGAIPTTRTTANGTGDLPNSQTNNSGSWKYEGNNGISMLASGSQSAGAVVVAIVTTGRTSVTVNWRAGTILQQASRDHSVALQYRVGTTATWTDVGTTTTYTSAGKSDGDFSGTLTEVLPAAANNQAVVQVRWIYWESAGSSGSRDRIAVDDISITSSVMATAPTVSTTALANGTTVNTDSATVPGGNVTNAGTATVTARGIVWGTATDPTISNNIVSGGTGTGAFTVPAITGLTPNTRYYYRAYATNSVDTAYGTTYSFVTKANTPGAPVIDTESITVTQLALSLNENSNNNTVVYSIRVNGTNFVQADGTLGTTEVLQTAAVWNSPIIVSGLTANTQYTFDSRARTMTTGGVIGTSTFTDYSPVATATTLPATSPMLTIDSSAIDFGNTCINTTSATGSFTFTGANISGNGTLEVSALEGFTYSLTENGTYTPTLTITNFTGASTTVYVHFSPTTVQSYNGSISVAGQGDNSSAQLTVNATGAGINPAGTVTTSTPATGIAVTSATLAGTATAGACSAFSAYGFEYSTTNNFANGSGTQVVSNNLTGGNFSATVTGLLPNTTYYFKAYGTDGTSTYYGVQRSFTTTALTTNPVTTAATEVTQTTFTANWATIEGAQSYRLDISTNANFATGLASELIISEYVEGGTQASNPEATNSDRAIEIYNGTGNTVDLSTYSLRTAINGSTSFTGNLTLSGTLEHGQAYVITSSSAGAPMRAAADKIVAYSTDNIAVFFTGNDAIGLFKSETMIDVVGVSQSSGNWGADVTLRRKSNISTPSTTYSSAEWDTYALNTIDGLGSHVYDFTPVFLAGYENATVNGTSLTITGLDPYTAYYYRVRAYSPNSTTGNSNVTSVTTKPAVVTWTGTPAAWVPNVTPDSTIDVVIDANFTTGTNSLAVKNITLNNGKTFTVTRGTTLTVEESITNNAAVADFVVQNNAALLQNTDVNNTDDITVIKNSNQLFRLDYTLWSSPVSGLTLGDFSPQTTTGRFYEYKYDFDATLGANVEQYFIVDPSTQFEEAKGYLIRMPNGNLSVPGYNGGTIAYSYEGIFTGTPNNGTVSKTASTQGDRFTAVGNPYPSPISVVDFFTTNSGVLNETSGLYFWRKRNGAGDSSYATLTLAGYASSQEEEGYVPSPVEGGDPAGQASYYQGAENTWLISQGQGFIVKTKAAPSTTDITFNNAMRRPAPASGNQGFFRTASSTRSRIWLNLKNSQQGFSQAAVAYMDNATNGIDFGYDGAMLNDSRGIALYTIAENTNLSVQARPAFTANDVVALGFTTATAGQFTINVSRVDGLFEQGQQVFIKDNLLNTVTSLEETYSFTSEAGTFNGRFEIVYAASPILGNNNPILDANSVVVFKEGNNININISTGNNTINSVTVYDINGRTLYNKNNMNSSKASVNNLQVAQQVLIIEVNTEKGKVSKRIVF
ncbi:S-layer family protein [Flavobacterium sp. Sd200]|uniref:beta strand repeat-containing protein n=1 Tax=Flavobacterium sp. Sd200 TaxID=2692211 RepID=UPI001367E858|nr:lamin tail domain-containing protein [Flavobacterium sp. Sd200]